nr:MAG TPA: hypothetical protein [Caudoviricetes sp.]
MGFDAYWARNRFCHDRASPFLLYKRYSYTAPEGSAVYPLRMHRKYLLQ